MDGIIEKGEILSRAVENKQVNFSKRVDTKIAEIFMSFAESEGISGKLQKETDGLIDVLNGMNDAIMDFYAFLTAFSLMPKGEGLEVFQPKCQKAIDAFNDLSTAILTDLEDAMINVQNVMADEVAKEVGPDGSKYRIEE